MLLEHHLHLAGIDVVPTRDDQLFDSTADGERPVFADLTDVAGAKPALAKHVGGGRWISPVALEDLAALQLDFILFAQPHFDAGQWIANAARLARPIVRIGDHNPALGYAIALEHRLPEDSLAAFKKGYRQWGGSGDEKSNLPQIRWMLIEVVTQPLIHRRYPEEHGAASLQLADNGLRAERHQHRAAAADQRAMQRDGEPVDMEQGKRQDQAVLGRPSPGLDHATALGEQVAVIEQGTLRLARRARRVKENCRTLRMKRPPTPILPHKGGGSSGSDPARGGRCFRHSGTDARNRRLARVARQSGVGGIASVSLNAGFIPTTVAPIHCSPR